MEKGSTCLSDLASDAREIIVEVGKYRVCSLDRRDINVVAELFAETRVDTKTDPELSYLGASRSEVFQFYRRDLLRGYNDGLGYVALDPSDRMVAAFYYHEYHGIHDGVPDPVDEEDPENLSHAMLIYRQVCRDLDTVVESWLKERHYRRVVILDLSCVLPEARGARITTAVYKHHIQRCRSLGYEALVTDTTNLFSTRLIPPTCEVIAKFEFETWEILGEFPYRGCNEAALESLRSEGLYRDWMGTDICTENIAFFMDLSDVILARSSCLNFKIVPLRRKYLSDSVRLIRKSRSLSAEFSDEILTDALSSLIAGENEPLVCSVALRHPEEEFVGLFIRQEYRFKKEVANSEVILETLSSLKEVYLGSVVSIAVCSVSDSLEALAADAFLSIS